MLKVGWVLAILCGLCWWASEMPLPGNISQPSAQEQDAWRRTINGWEKTSDWFYPTIEKSSPAFHPSLLGLLMILIPTTISFAKTEST